MKFVAAGLGVVEVVLAFVVVFVVAWALVVVVGLVVACPCVVVPALVVVVGEITVPVPVLVVPLGTQDPLDCLLTFRTLEDLFRTSCLD